MRASAPLRDRMRIAWSLIEAAALGIAGKPIERHVERALFIQNGKLLRASRLARPALAILPAGAAPRSVMVAALLRGVADAALGRAVEPHVRNALFAQDKSLRSFEFRYETRLSDAGIPARRPTAETDYSIAVPFEFSVAPTGHGVLAVIVHAYYLDLVGDILAKLKNIARPADLFLSTDTEEKRAAITALASDWSLGSVDIRVFPNRGRDIAPKLVGFKDVYDRYELFLHLHTKGATYAEPTLYGWRDYLLDNLVGTPEIVDGILSLFANPRTGIVFPEHLFALRKWLDWGYNFDHARRLLSRLGVALDGNTILDFPSGSMFWGRSSALRPLLDLQLDWSDFPPEEGQIDGTLAHAIERSILYVAEISGHEWLKVVQPAVYPRRDTVLAVRSADEIDMVRPVVFRSCLPPVTEGWEAKQQEYADPERYGGSTGFDALIDAVCARFLRRMPEPHERTYFRKVIAEDGIKTFIASVADGEEAANLHGKAPLFFPLGHPRSPICDPAELERAGWREFADRGEQPLPGLTLDMDAMTRFWADAIAPTLADVPFSENGDERHRYRFVNPEYSYGDGLTLRAMLLHHKPQRIIQAGCGWSSACLLDTCFDELSYRPAITFIEPDPELLSPFTKPDDVARVTVMARPLQTVPLEIFDQLGPNDILFVDSSHVLKTGSDVVFALCEILPRLQPGVVVHFHDVFYPFEYSREWVIDENRSWNEIYALRTFLSFNDAFRIVFFSDAFRRLAPQPAFEGAELFLKNSGGAIWIERRA